MSDPQITDELDTSAPLRSLEGELMALIATNADRMQLITIAGAAVAAAILMLHVSPIYALLWLSAVALAVLVRTRMLIRAQADPDQDDARKLRVALSAFLITATAQSSIMLFLHAVPTSAGAVLTIYLTGMCAGMIPSTAGHVPIVRAYTIVAMSAISIAWGLAPDPDFGTLDRVLLAVMVAAYAKVMLDYARGAHKVFDESYRIRQERMALNQRLATALRNEESASRAKTRFLASASHDLRQPLHALSLFSGSMLMRPLDTRSAGIARQIDKSVRMLGSQLDALLDISRLDAGVIARAVESLELSGMLEQLVDEFREQAQTKGLRLSLQCPRDFYVRSDPMLLRRIVMNLISNAIKFTEAGQIRVTVQAGAPHCRIRVSDTGIGIPVSEQSRVFEEFYQLGNPERDRARGLGLGLSIVRRLADLLGLTLQMHSEPGKGTEFMINQLELAPVPVAAKAAAEELPKGPMLRVLVVDDEEDVRLGMKVLLEEMGFQVQIAASTSAAVECSRHFTPSVLLADMRLAGRDNGILTVKTLRLRWPHLPAMIVSGDTAPDRLQEAQAENIELLHKPVSADVLREALMRIAA